MYGSINRDLTQKDGWKMQDGRMTKNCRARPGMHSLARHFFRGSAVLSLPAVLLRKVCNGNTWPRGTINFDFILLEFSRFYPSFLFKLLNCIRDYSKAEIKYDDSNAWRFVLSGCLVEYFNISGCERVASPSCIKSAGRSR